MKTENEYTPIEGFLDLRNFDITDKEFKQCHKIQLILKKYADKQKENSNFKINNKFNWEKAKNISAELQCFLLPRLRKGAEL